MNTKICSRCNQTKEWSQFGIVKRNNRPRPRCHACEAELQKEYRERHPEQKEASMALLQKWKAANPEKVRERNNAKQRERWANNPEWRARKTKVKNEWSKTPKGKLVRQRYRKSENGKLYNRRSRHLRRARERNLPATLTTDEWQETLEGCDFKCVYCGEPWEHQDHFIPVSKGGGYTKLNIVPVCARCNIVKGNTMPFDFICE